MILKIRTKDELDELMKKNISYSWKISAWRLDLIKEIQIYSFNGKNRIRAEFDRERSELLENGRVAIAFKKAIVEPSDHNWIGQNPVNFENDESKGDVAEKIIKSKLTNKNTSIQIEIENRTIELYEKDLENKFSLWKVTLRFFFFF
jgi:hypothetical protein